MKKMRIFALMLAVVMLTSGCSLIVKDEAADAALVIVDVNGETVDKATINQQIDDEIGYNEQMNQLYMSYYGFDAGYSTDRAEVGKDVIRRNINRLVALQKAKELGLDQLTEEEATQAKEAALANYETQISDISATIFATLSAEDARPKAVEYAKDFDITEEIYTATEIQNKVFDKLMEYVVQDITVADDVVEENLNKMVEADKGMFETSPSYFGDYFNQNMGRVYYAPAGYRFVKHILISYNDEDQALIDEKLNAVTSAYMALNNAAEGADTAALQADVDAAQAAFDDARAKAAANIQPTLDEVYALATAEDADFDALIAQYGTDPGQGPKGYVVCEGYEGFVQGFTDAAMALENPGDVSEPVGTDFGYHILQYVGDIPEGAFDIEAAREEMKESLLSEAQQTHFGNQLDAWISEADVKTYENRLN